MAVERLVKTFVLGLALTRTVNGLRQAMKIAAARLAMGAFAVTLLLTAAGFLLAAAYMATATLIGPVYAALAIGVVLLLKAWFWMVLAKRFGSRQHGRVAG